MTEIQKRLFALQDKEYGAFTAKLSPTVDPDTIIGVRLPDVRALAKELKGTAEAEAFLNDLPHRYFEEYHLHSFLLTYIKDFDTAVREVTRYLPYVDNWAVCDSTRVKIFEKQPDKILPYIETWLKSDQPYTVRFGILCLMISFLGDRFDEKYPAMVAAVKSEEYYVRMMQAWYFATALAKQYDAALPYIQNNVLEKWTHNKTIQKAIESYRVSDEHKAILRSYKRK